MGIQQIWQLSGLGLRSNFGIEGVVGLVRANSTMIRAFSAPNGFWKINPGRCRWAGMSDAFGVKRDNQRSALRSDLRLPSTKPPRCEESRDSLPEVYAGLRPPATICYPSGV